MHSECRSNLGPFTPRLRISTHASRGTLLSLLASLALVLAGTVRGETRSPRVSGNLFLDVAGVPASLSPSLVRERAVRINRAFLPSATSGAGTRIHFNLFPDVSPEGQVDWSVVRGPASYTCGGQLVSGGSGRFVLSVEGEAVCGKIHTADRGTFAIRCRGDGLWEIAQANPARMPLDEMDTVADEFGGAVRKQVLAGATRKEAGVPLIDVMVVYTPSACAGVGGTAAMLALIHLIVDETNQIFFQQSDPRPHRPRACPGADL